MVIQVFGQEIMDRDIEDFFGVRRDDIEEAINSVNNLAKKVVSNFLLGNQYGGGKSEDDINKFKDEYNKLPQKIKDIVEQIKNKLKCNEYNIDETLHDMSVFFSM